VIHDAIASEYRKLYGGLPAPVRQYLATQPPRDFLDRVAELVRGGRMSLHEGAKMAVLEQILLNSKGE